MFFAFILGGFLMAHIISNILIGFSNFPFFAILFTLPIMVVPVLHYKKLNLVRIGMNYLFLLYILCLFALVFLPLPDLKQMGALNSYDVQAVPFMFVADIIRESPFVWNQPSTYVAALTDNAIWQVIFNIAMTIPFGMFLSYYCGCSKKKVVIFTALLSLAIEVTQLTGFFFIFNGSYRLCDVDDLMANTCGGFLGAVIVNQLRGVLPAINRFDLEIAHTAKAQKVLNQST